MLEHHRRCMHTVDGEGLRTSWTVYARRRPPTLADTFSVTVVYEYHLNITL